MSFAEGRCHKVNVLCASSATLYKAHLKINPVPYALSIRMRFGRGSVLIPPERVFAWALNRKELKEKCITTRNREIVMHHLRQQPFRHRQNRQGDGERVGCLTKNWRCKRFGPSTGRIAVNETSSSR